MTSVTQKMIMVAALATLAAAPPVAFAANKKAKSAKSSMPTEAPPPPPESMPPESTSPTPPPPESAPSGPGAGATDAASPANSAGTVVDVISSSPDHTTLLAALKAAGLDGALAGAGPFTVFAPTNAAFERLPAGTVDTLLKPESRNMLSGILASHVVAGSIGAAELTQQITAGGGTAKLTTATGALLTAKMDGNAVIISDGSGGTARVTAVDLKQGNGVVHVIDGVLQPKVPTPASPAAQKSPSPPSPERRN